MSSRPLAQGSSLVSEIVKEAYYATAQAAPAQSCALDGAEAAHDVRRRPRRRAAARVAHPFSDEVRLAACRVSKGATGIRKVGSS